MKKPKIKYGIDYWGTIYKYQLKSWWKRLFTAKWDEYDEVGVWSPRKQYTDAEKKKLERINYYHADFTEEEIMIIANAIRPNTFKESFSEINSGKYYVNVAAKEDLDLLRAVK